MLQGTMNSCGNRAKPDGVEQRHVRNWIEARKVQEAQAAKEKGIMQRVFDGVIWLAALPVSWAMVVLEAICSPLLWVLYGEAKRREEAAWTTEYKKVAKATKVAVRTPLPIPDDIGKWRLDCFKGRQIWYVADKTDRPQGLIERIHTGQTSPADAGAGSKPSGLLDALQKAGDYVASIQSDDGHWSNDYGGPMFLLPGMVIAKYIMYKGKQDAMFPKAVRNEMVRYVKNVQNEDGGWGLSEEGCSTMFGSVMNYVCLRLLGVPKDDPRVKAAREFIQNNGGAIGIPTWGKCWLTLVNLYQWEGIKPVLPELWLLPKWLWFNPGRMWCHTRMVYIPVGYLFGVKFQAPVDPLITELRGEIFEKGQRFEDIDWDVAYAAVSPLDVHYPTHPVTLFAFKILRLYEKYLANGPCRFLRRMALRECVDHIEYDDVTTNFICLGPVNKVFNLIAMYQAQGMSDYVKLSESRLQDYLWLGKNGMKMNGYNGSQLWDTSFALQAYKACGLHEDAAYKTTIQQGLQYISDAQVLERFPMLAHYNRDDPYGAYNFSTAEQGWQVSDCTAEGLRVAILYDSLSTDRIRAGVDQLLSLRNADDGAWCSYEPRRSPTWLELLNPADVFTRIMVEYTYTECSSASMQTLRRFIESRHCSNYQRKAILESMRCGAKMIKKMQYAHGGWYGNWGVCFTYGTLFGIEGLLCAGEPKSCAEIKRAVAFLMSKQRADGGWSEHVHSCASREYTEATDLHAASLPVQTALSLMGLTAAASRSASAEHLAAMDRAAQFLMETQRGGSWEQPTICGIFNGTCGIHYPFYPVVMPFWALAHYKHFKSGAPDALGEHAAHHDVWLRFVEGSA
eukprot:TRINITY_DN7713_c0_g1_i1.p1 TRINITY_DN7713_c0_g1~~TRINITY_DN7713_c0_g1_i1.p1  ORF type:complete len:848 (+),score=243.57 TRINITY_DN7713_c0_g1_i1:38-2581(+)